MIQAAHICDLKLSVGQEAHSLAGISHRLPCSISRARFSPISKLTQVVARIHFLMVTGRRSLAVSSDLTWFLEATCCATFRYLKWGSLLLPIQQETLAIVCNHKTHHRSDNSLLLLHLLARTKPSVTSTLGLFEGHDSLRIALEVCPPHTKTCV